MRRLLGTCMLAGAAVMSAACSEDGASSEACYPGDFAYGDAAADGAVTYRRCVANGSSYAPYEGDPTSVPDAGAAPDVSAPDASSSCDPSAGPMAFMCGGCATNDQCADGVCFSFNKKGARCTHSCTTALDCPAPSAGCGNQGVCKPQ